MLFIYNAVECSGNLHVYIYFSPIFYSLLNRKGLTVGNDDCTKSFKHLEWHELDYFLLNKMKMHYDSWSLVKII